MNFLWLLRIFRDFWEFFENFYNIFFFFISQNFRLILLQENIIKKILKILENYEVFF